ncbi:uncharacterized protein [Solanum lycopersicum]|uniref:uncharacterized protein n=1 Tax=Solanum lycopersicum TaxID=4081 RepID=UPI00374A1AAE
MRLQNSDSDTDLKGLKEFFDWILTFRDGSIGNSFDSIDKVVIRMDLLITECIDPIAAIVETLEHVHTPEFLDTIKCSRVPNHSINLKVGVPVISLRNIDQTTVLCNGTRLIVTKLGNQVIEAKVLSDRWLD